MKILATSDTHGYLPDVSVQFDLLLICGDICPAHDHYYAYQDEWLRNEFVYWVNSLPFKDIYSKVVLVPGNHDFALERYNKNDIKALEGLTVNKLVVLKNKGCTLDFLTDNGLEQISIFGTPYCKLFGNWAFMVDNDKLTEKFSEIPENLDILLSHDAPSINGFGLIQMGPYKGTDASNIPLGKAIEDKKPRIALHGHIHSSKHEFKDYDGTWMSCVSYIDENYQPKYPILEFDYNPSTKEVVY